MRRRLSWSLLSLLIAVACTATNPAFLPRDGHDGAAGSAGTGAGGAGSGGGGGQSDGSAAPDGQQETAALLDVGEPDRPAPVDLPPAETAVDSPAADAQVDAPPETARDLPPDLALPARRVTLANGSSTRAYGDTAAAGASTDICPGNQALTGFNLQHPSGRGMVQRIEGLCGTLVVMAGATYTISVSAGATLPARGGTSDVRGAVTCPPHQVVVGFFGRAGGFLDQLGVRCAPLLVGPDGVTVTGAAETRVGPLPPATGGSAFDERCPADQLVRGYEVNHGSWIDALALRCAHATLAP